MGYALVIIGLLIAVGGFFVSFIQGIIQYKTAFKARLKQGLWCLLWGVVLLVLGFVIAPSPSQTPSSEAGPQIQTKQHEQIEAKEEQTKKALNALTKYLHENYGGAGNPNYQTSWYGLIKNIELSLAADNRAVVTVKTDIWPDEEGKKIGSLIANVILLNDVVDVKSVMVLGQNDHIVAIKDK